jgi:hypothetical protein
MSFLCFRWILPDLGASEPGKRFRQGLFDIGFFNIGLFDAGFSDCQNPTAIVNSVSLDLALVILLVKDSQSP